MALGLPVKSAAMLSDRETIRVDYAAIQRVKDRRNYLSTERDHSAMAKLCATTEHSGKPG